MTEFTKASKQVEEINNSLEAIIQNSFWGGCQNEIDAIRSELFGSIAEKMNKFKARIEETDPGKRTYGPAMEAKVKTFLQQYDEVVKKFELTAEAVAANYEVFEAEQKGLEEERQKRLHQAELEEKRREEEKERKRLEAEHLQTQRTQKAALQEELERKEMFARRLERERVAHAQKELEARAEVALMEKRARQQLEDDIRVKRRREEAKEEKRQRLGTILEQHRQLKEKSEQQLLAEAIAMSLKESSPRKEEVAPEPRADTEGVTAMEVDQEETTPEEKPASAPIPPAADLETEEMLIKQAIELSLKLSPPPPEQPQSR